MVALLFTLVPLALAVAVGWLVVRYVSKRGIGQYVTERYSQATVWFLGLATIALVGLVGGLGTYVAIGQLHGDPCLSDWDFECATPWAERLSQFQVFLFIPIIIGQGAALAAFAVGAYLTGKAIVRATTRTALAKP